MSDSFYIQAIRFGRHNAVPIVLDWVMVRSADIADVKRQARIMAETACAPEWVLPLAEVIRVVDTTGKERFRCWSRVVLKHGKASLSPAPSELACTEFR